jgi:hypothetical protein
MDEIRQEAFSRLASSCNSIPTLHELCLEHPASCQSSLLSIDNFEKVSLEDSESVVNEYNDANLNENLNDPVEKVSNNVNSNSVIPRLPDIKIDVPMEKVSLKVSESINDKYSDKDTNSDIYIPKLPNIKMEIMTEAKLSEEDMIIS